MIVNDSEAVDLGQKINLDIKKICFEFRKKVEEEIDKEELNMKVDYFDQQSEEEHDKDGNKDDQYAKRDDNPNMKQPVEQQIINEVDNTNTPQINKESSSWDPKEGKTEIEKNGNKKINNVGNPQINKGKVINKDPKEAKTIIGERTPKKLTTYPEKIKKKESGDRSSKSNCCGCC